MQNRRKLDITNEIELITPAFAEEALGGKAHNRRIHNSNVTKFERLIQSGDFHLTPQGLAFDVEGRLIDGQHRLWAIFNTGISVEMMVSRGWPTDTQQFIDQGLIRTVVDIHNMRHPDNEANSYYMAVSRRMCIGTRGTLLLTTHDQVHFAEQHDAALTFAVSDALQGKRPQRVAVAGVGAVIARAFYHEDKGRLLDFGATMIGIRMPQGEDDSGAHLLREWLLQGQPIYGTTRVSRDLLAYMKAQRGLVAFLARERLRILYPQQDEVWMLPNEERRPRPLLKKKPLDKKRDVGDKSDGKKR